MTVYKRGHSAQYLEAQVMGASPLELINLLYRGAIDAVGSARRYLAAGNIRQRSNQITRAWDILHELSTSLDVSQDSELARNLRDLYGYIQSRLLDANDRQADEPLAEAERLLTTLAGAWRDA